MTSTAEIILRLRSQHTEIAHRAADTIEQLAAAEEEARNTLDELLDQQVRLLAQLQMTEIGGWSWRKVARNS